MKKICCTILLIWAAVVAHATGFIHRDGQQLRDGNNQQIHLNGVNLGGWLLWEGWIWGGKFTAQSTIYSNMVKAAGQTDADAFREDVYRNYISEKDIKAVSEMGMNVVRVPFNHRIFDTTGGKAIGWEILDSVLNWCSRYKVYAVLDMHAAPGGNSSYFIADPDKKTVWKSAEAQRKTVELWKQIAARYHSNPIVAGYDLLNEPIPPGDPALIDLYKRIIQAIRSVDTNHLLIIEGSNFAKRFKSFRSLPDQNMAFSFHLYTWFGGKPEEKVEDYIAIGKQLNVPFWCGEWGENSYEIIENTLKVLTNPSNNFCGWCFWTWKKVPNKMTSLVSIQTKTEWTPFIQWCCKPKKEGEPGQEHARNLLLAFRSEMRFENCQVDTRLQQIMRTYAAK